MLNLRDVQLLSFALESQAGSSQIETPRSTACTSMMAGMDSI